MNCIASETNEAERRPTCAESPHLFYAGVFCPDAVIEVIECVQEGFEHESAHFISRIERQCDEAQTPLIFCFDGL